MRVIYNGVDMMAVETHEFSAVPVYDDTQTDYLYTKYTVHVTAITTDLLAPAPLAGPFMQYAFGEGERANATPSPRRAPSPPVSTVTPGIGDGVGIAESPALNPPREVVFVPATCPTTHRTVRHRLSTPQGPLYVFAGRGFEADNPRNGFAPPRFPLAQMLLASPNAGATVDCLNGPKPLKFEITAAVGDATTFTVEFAVETYVNEAKENNERPYGALLSNRWSQTHNVDGDGYTTVVTEGVAVFRTDLVYVLNLPPDNNRSILFMPVPQGFTREIDYVTTRPDVSGISYRYTDKQVPVNFVAGPFVGAAKISAVHQQKVTSDQDVLGNGIRSVERALGMILNMKWLRAKPDEEAKKVIPKHMPGESHGH